MLPILGLIGELFTPAAALIDSMHTSDEEKLAAKQGLLQIQADANDKVQQFQTEVLKAQAGIVTAEANSQSWLARNWRPMTMLAFVVAVMGYWFGLTPEGIPQDSVDAMFDLVKIGLGGYVVGRSGEKIATNVAKVFADRKS